MNQRNNNQNHLSNGKWFSLYNKYPPVIRRDIYYPFMQDFPFTSFVSLKNSRWSLRNNDTR